MDEEEAEGKRTDEDKYMGLTANLASVSLVTSLLDPHKIIQRSFSLVASFVAKVTCHNCICLL